MPHKIDQVAFAEEKFKTHTNADKRMQTYHIQVSGLTTVLGTISEQNQTSVLLLLTVNKCCSQQTTVTQSSAN